MKHAVKNLVMCSDGNFSYKWADIYYSQTTLYSQISILLSRKDSADY